MKYDKTENQTVENNCVTKDKLYLVLKYYFIIQVKVVKCKI